ncbi:MAG: hypothetical protein NW205_13930 [Hyphomicrobiaceae bacterium]|nr:hypothetical protein [Hyphomicrobiaceae bacterium]
MLKKLKGPGGTLRPAAHATSVLAYLRDTVLRGHLARLGGAAALGTLARILNLLAFVAAIKAILVVLDAPRLSAELTPLLQQWGIGITLSAQTAVLYAVGLLVTLNVLALLAAFARQWAVASFQSAFVSRALAPAAPVDIDHDRFILERVAPAIHLIVKLAEIALFAIVVVGLIALISPRLMLILLPLMLLIPGGVIIARRRRLRLLAQRKSARAAYLAGAPDRADDSSDLGPWAAGPRLAYADAVLAVQRFQMRNQQIGILATSLGLVAIILYLAYGVSGPLAATSLAPPLIFVVLALRQLMVYANEAGRDLSSLLELRSGLPSADGRPAARPDQDAEDEDF